MSNGASQLGDLLSAPLEELLVALASGIGRSQSELDRHSIEIQRLIDEDPVLSQYGLEATWYQLPNTQLQLKVAVAMQQSAAPAPGPVPAQPPGGPPQPPTPGPTIGGVARPPLPRLFIQPVNPRVQNLFSYDVNAASTISVSIVAVPPPGQAAAGTPTMTRDQALTAARPYLFPKDATKSPEDRVTVNYNPGARAWYVVQTREDALGVVTVRALVKIDDASGNVIRTVGGPS